MKIGFLSDIHEDVIRLRQALGILHDNNCDEIVCLGDVTGFSTPYYSYEKERNASACIELVKNNCKYILSGNHDLFDAKKIPEYSAGVHYPLDFFNMPLAEKQEILGDQIWFYEEDTLDPELNESEFSYLKTLAEFKVVERENGIILYSHFLFPNLSGSKRTFAGQQIDTAEHLSFLKKLKCDISFHGHAHIEGAVFIDERGTFTEHSFGKYCLKSKVKAVIGPCVANGTNDNGLMVFDTESRELDIVPLNTPKIARR